MKILLRPVLKWVGGKHQLLDEIDKRLPRRFTLYVEPFIGGGAVWLHRHPKHVRINDSNEELINVYRVIRDDPDELLKLLKMHEERNTEKGSEWFYEVRAWDRTDRYAALSPTEKAARIIYLNKTCYNGLFRVNLAGQLNSPYGRYKHPNIVNEAGIMALHDYLAHADVDMRCGDFAEALQDLPRGAFVYLDPPYMPLNVTSSFTGYTQGGFGYAEQVRLRDVCATLRDRGIHFLESNSDTPEIRKLYQDFEIETVEAKRAINSKADRRGAVNEVLIHG